MNQANRQQDILIFAFALAFAVWFITDRYTGLGSGGLSVVICLSAMALPALWAYRCLRTRTLRLARPIVAIGLLAGMELLWRHRVRPLPNNGFKDVAIAVYYAQPVIAVLGIAAVAVALSNFKRTPEPRP